MKIPSPGESITEVEISSCLVKDGDYVDKDQPIVEIDSDKATLELSAQESGIISFKVKKGETVPVGAIICYIDTSVSVSSSSTKKEFFLKENLEDKKDNLNNHKKITKDENDLTISSKDINSYAFKIPSPSARKILNEKHCLSGQIKGTGKMGRITKEDAVKAVVAMGTTTLSSRLSRRSSLSTLRRNLSKRLILVKNEMAMLTTFNEIDMSKIFYLRQKFKEAFIEKHGVSLGFMSFFTKASIRALNLYPDINAMIDGNNKINFEYCDISIAVSGPKGLMVPVLRNAELLSFRGIEQKIKELALRVHNMQISVDEMTGGTFTITNGGIFGSMLSTPIINPPQSAILGMHNIIDRPIAINGKIEIRPIMYVALSYDHRIIDGKESVGFLIAIKEAIEDPIQYLTNFNPEQAFEL